MANKKKWMNWFVLALVSMLLFTVMNLLFKKELDAGMRSDVLVMYIFLFGGVLGIVYLMGKGVPLGISNASIFFLFLAAIVSIAANFVLTESIRIAPNPGYSLAVNSAQILLVVVASYFLFKSDFTLIKGVGAVLTTIGIVMLGL